MQEGVNGRQAMAVARVKGSVHIAVLDSLRAFAALSVCLFHFVCTTTDFVFNRFAVNVFSAGKYGVELFFVISGFIIPWSMHYAGYKPANFFTFLIKRLCRLEPPYIISIGVAIALLLLRARLLDLPLEPGALSFKRIILHAGYLIPFFEGNRWLNPVYWTLAIEFQFYLLMALLFTPLLKLNRFGRIGVIMLFILLSNLGPAFLIFHWMPFFLLGIMLFLVMADYVSKREFYFIVAVLMIYGLFKFPAASLVFAAFPLFFVLYFRDLEVPLLRTLGKFSYSIYLMHPLIGASFINVLSHGYKEPFAKLAIIAGGILVTLFSAWLTYILVERPSKKLSASITYVRKEQGKFELLNNK